MILKLARFVTVGAAGFVVQIASLAAFTILFDWLWLPATAVAVECAVVHNYFWHERWTWHDDSAGSLSLIRFVRFNIANGAASLFGNIMLMWLLVDGLGLPAVPSNIIAVGVMSALNFVVADRWVFRRHATTRNTAVASVTTVAVMLIFAVPSAATAGPVRATVDAWTQYIAQTENRLESAQAGTHQAPRDTVAVRGSSVSVAGGTISHWRGSVFVRGVTLDRLLDGLMRPGTPPPQEDVVASRVIAHNSDSIRLSIRLVRRAIVTVTYDTEHEMTFTRRSPTVATARSVATRIDEVGGTDHGFLWRLHSYWRYEQQPGGVLVELDSVTLSRDVPAFVRTVATPLVNRIARESMSRTLDALRRYYS